MISILVPLTAVVVCPLRVVVGLASTDIDYSKIGPQSSSIRLPNSSNLVGENKLEGISESAGEISLSPKHFENGQDINKNSIPDYLPEKTAVRSVSELYPAVLGKLFQRVLLPSKGKKPENCSSWTPTFFCSNCGKPHFTKGNCKKSTCPDCALGWRWDRSQSIMERVLSQKLNRNLRCRHFVVSSEVEDYPETIEELKELRREAYEFAKGKGVEGGVIIFHPFRILPNAGFDDSYMGWKNLLELEYSKILENVYWSPHFHIIGVGQKGNKTFEGAKESDRFIWKGISELSDSEALGRCTMYLLSHTGVFEKSHYASLVWFGSLSSSKWSLDRAVKKLKNGSTVKDFVLDMVEEFVGNFEDSETEGTLECDNCGSSLLHISSAPDYWEKKNLEFEAELRVAYSWWRGSIPPPENVESEADCWAYLNSFLKKGESHIGKMVQGRSCLKVFGEVEKLG